MEKKIAGLLGAVSAIALATPASAMPNVDAVMQVKSYAELLRPIPNAQALLEASDAAAAQASDAHGAVQEVQFVQFFPHHHHHHHHHHRRRYYHHHHHHHHNSAARIIGGVVAGLERR